MAENCHICKNVISNFQAMKSSLREIQIRIYGQKVSKTYFEVNQKRAVAYI